MLLDFLRCGHLSIDRPHDTQKNEQKETVSDPNDLEIRNTHFVDVVENVEA